MFHALANPPVVQLHVTETLGEVVVAGRQCAYVGGERRDNRNRSFQGKDRDKDRDRNKGKFGGDRDKGRDNRGRDRDKGRDRQGGPSLRPYASSANPRERDRPADPNSPFAKLAALKEQLSGRKE